MHSHHSHSGAFCSHASQETSPQSMLQRANDLGLSSYCFSEHIPRSKESQLYPEEVEAGITPEILEQRFEDYLIEARRCSEMWKASDEEEMQVLVGAELENIDDDCIDYVEKILNGSGASKDASRGAAAGKGRIDYVIGSLHHVDGIPIDFDKSTFELALDTFRHGGDEKVDSFTQRRRAHLRLMIRYLDLQLQLIKAFSPEVIGHFDLCRLFEPNTPMAVSISKEDDTECLSLLQSVDNRVHRNVEFICTYGGLFEINTSSIRKGWKTPYPGEEVLDIIIASGGKLCLSDDAHSHEQVGLNYHKAKEYLERKGIKSIWMLQRAAEASMAFPRGTMAVEMADWSKHTFWSTRVN